MISVVVACLNIGFDTGSHESLGMRFTVSGLYCDTEYDECITTTGARGNSWRVREVGSSSRSAPLWTASGGSVFFFQNLREFGHPLVRPKGCPVTL